MWECQKEVEKKEGEKERMSWRGVCILMNCHWQFFGTNEQCGPGSSFKIAHLNFQNNMI